MSGSGRDLVDFDDTDPDPTRRAPPAPPIDDPLSELDDAPSLLPPRVPPSRNGRGRPQSPPKAAPARYGVRVEPTTLPALIELHALARWVCYRLEPTDKGKLTKVPHNARSGGKASSTNPRTWSSHEEAWAAQLKASSTVTPYAEVGFVFSETDDIAGVDLDNCVTVNEISDEPEVAAWAQYLVDQLASYTEISPSGTGLHIFVHGRLHPNYGSVVAVLDATGTAAGKMEIYDRSRFFTVTGRHLGDTPTEIRACATLAAIHAEHWNPREPIGAPRPVEPVAGDDADILAEACADPFNGAKLRDCLDGEWQPHYPGKTPSEPDMGVARLLAPWCGYDQARVERIMRASKLHREKWDANKGYLTRTIAKACADDAPRAPRAKPVPRGKPAAEPRAEPAAEPESEPTAEPEEPAVLVSDTEQPEAAEPDDVTWPVMGEAAYYGLAGEIVRTIDPYSEADPVATLAHLLTAFGSLAGRGPHATVGHTRHPARLFAAIVGPTAGGRKGLAWSTPRYMLEQLDPVWVGKRVQSGLSSGEGLIMCVRDARDEEQPVKEKGRVVGYQKVRVDPGEEDKRLLVIEPELAVVFRRMAGDGNSLSGLLRSAWDDLPLATMTKRSPMHATGAHISLVGHITPEELVVYLTDTEKANGFGNRLLYFLVRRSKFLSSGPTVPDALLRPLVARLRAAMQSAVARAALIVRDTETEAAWDAGYRTLSAGRPGLLGALLNRVEAQVLRLSLIYSLLDRAPMVQRPHLEAALAVWTYTEQSPSTSSARASWGSRPLTLSWRPSPSACRLR